MYRCPSFVTKDDLEFLCAKHSNLKLNQEGISKKIEEIIIYLMSQDKDLQKIIQGVHASFDSGTGGGNFCCIYNTRMGVFDSKRKFIAFCKKYRFKITFQEIPVDKAQSNKPWKAWVYTTPENISKLLYWYEQEMLNNINNQNINTDTMEKIQPYEVNLSFLDGTKVSGNTMRNTKLIADEAFFKRVKEIIIEAMVMRLSDQEKKYKLSKESAVAYIDKIKLIKHINIDAGSDAIRSLEIYFLPYSNINTKGKTISLKTEGEIFDLFSGLGFICTASKNISEVSMVVKIEVTSIKNFINMFEYTDPNNNGFHIKLRLDNAHVLYVVGHTMQYDSHNDRILQYEPVSQKVIEFLPNETKIEAEELFVETILWADEAYQQKDRDILIIFKEFMQKVFIYNEEFLKMNQFKIEEVLFMENLGIAGKTLKLTINSADQMSPVSKYIYKHLKKKSDAGSEGFRFPEFFKLIDRQGNNKFIFDINPLVQNTAHQVAQVVASSEFTIKKYDSEREKLNSIALDRSIIAIDACKRHLAALLLEDILNQTVFFLKMKGIIMNFIKELFPLSEQRRAGSSSAPFLQSKNFEKEIYQIYFNGFEKRSNEHDNAMYDLIQIEKKLFFPTGLCYIYFEGAKKSFEFDLSKAYEEYKKMREGIISIFEPLVKEETMIQKEEATINKKETEYSKKSLSREDFVSNMSGLMGETYDHIIEPYQAEIERLNLLLGEKDFKPEDFKPEDLSRYTVSGIIEYLARFAKDEQLIIMDNPYITSIMYTKNNK